MESRKLADEKVCCLGSTGNGLNNCKTAASIRTWFWEIVRAGTAGGLDSVVAEQHFMWPPQQQAQA